MSNQMKQDEQVKRGPDEDIDLAHVNEVNPQNTPVEEIDGSFGVLSKEEQEALKKPGTGSIVETSAPSDDFATQPLGTKVYDKGESIVSKMNTQSAVFDKDLFFGELYENYLVVVQRNDLRHLPSGVIVRWDRSTSFGDFLSDSLHHIEDQLRSIKHARDAHAQKFDILPDSILAEMKIDSGSNVLGQQFGNEDYDATEELLRRSEGVIKDYLAGRISMVIDSKSGRVSIVNANITKK